MTFTIDKDLAKPIYTPAAFRKAGYSEEVIARVFGKDVPRSPSEGSLPLGDKARWRTLKDGRHVAISGTEKRGAMTARGEARIRDMERDIAKNPFETAIFTDPNGEVLYRQKGEEEQVAFPKGTLEKMKDGVMTHNHPLPYGFSDTDIRVAVGYDLAEIRVIARDPDTGEKMLYRLTRPPEGWLGTSQAQRRFQGSKWQALDDIANMGNAAMRRAKAMARATTRRKGADYQAAKRKATRQAWHEVAQGVAYTFGAEYVRETVE